MKDSTPIACRTFLWFQCVDALAVGSGLYSHAAKDILTSLFKDNAGEDAFILHIEAKITGLATQPGQ